MSHWHNYAVICFFQPQLFKKRAHDLQQAQPQPPRAQFGVPKNKNDSHKCLGARGLSNPLPRCALRPIGRRYHYLGQIRESPIAQLYMVMMTAAYQEIQQTDVWALPEGSQIFKAPHASFNHSSIWSRVSFPSFLSFRTRVKQERTFFWRRSEKWRLEEFKI